MIDQSPLGFNRSARREDGEVDEANLFMPDDAPTGCVELANALDALLNEEVREANDEGDRVAQEQAEQDAAGEAATPPTDIDPLEALLAESMEPVRAKAEMRANRDKLARGGLTAQERKEIESKIREWESKVEWKGEANVLLIIRQECTRCGLRWHSNGGLFTRQVHRAQSHARRWVRAESELAQLPNETALKLEHVGMCYGCADERGFKVDSAKPLLEGEL